MWIKLDERLLDTDLMQNPNAMLIWVFLLLSANRKTKQFKNVTIKRGELVRTQENIAAATGLTRNQVRTALNYLEATKRITKKTTGKTVVISIVKYNEYQGDHQNITTTSPRIEKREKEDIFYPPSTPPTKPYHVPTLEEVREYERITSKGKDPDSFYRHYAGVDWNAGGHRIYDWQKLYDRWETPEPIKREAVQRVSTFTDPDGYTYTLIDGEYKVTGKPN